MAITGKFNFKGIEIDGAYVKIDTASFNHHEIKQQVLKTPAVLNEDGSVKTSAVMETEYVKSSPGYMSVRIYKDKAARDVDFNSYISVESYNFDNDLKASAKNIVNQAYVHLKTLDVFKDFTDV